MKSKYLERIEEAYKQFELFSVQNTVNNGDYLILARKMLKQAKNYLN